MKQKVVQVVVALFLAVQSLTAQAPVLVKDIKSGTEDAFQSSWGAKYLNSIGKNIYFAANDGIAGNELWVSDGTAAGTKLLKDINKGSADSNPGGFVLYNNELYFIAYTPEYGSELWKTNGTEAGTVLVKDIATGSGSSYLNSITVANGKLYMSATDGSSNEVFVSDGTTAGTIKLKAGDSGRDPSGFTTFNNKVYYYAGGLDFFGRELWVTDGTAAGTSLLQNINYIKYLTDAGDYMLYSASFSDTELWKTDGTVAGTTLLKSDMNGPRYFTKFRNFIVFENGGYLWKTDGTAAGTVKVSDLQLNSLQNSPKDFLIWNDKIYFGAQISGSFPSNHEFYVYDGVTVSLVKEIFSGNFGSTPTTITDASKYMVFAASDFNKGNEVWKSDGTDTGTTLLADINTGFSSSNPESFVYVAGNLFFTASTPSSGRELYKIDINTGSTDLIFTTDIAKVYPNPVSDMLYIQLNNPSDNIKVRIRNSMGALIYEQHNTAPINMQFAAKGLYVLEIQDGKKVQTQKIIH